VFAFADFFRMLRVQAEKAGRGASVWRRGVPTSDPGKNPARHPGAEKEGAEARAVSRMFVPGGTGD